ncbi:MAG: UDP-galactopyranose mutase [Treponema sp.]|nr:UDP-galactopyranose mutase [Treponema sp.]
MNDDTINVNSYDFFIVGAGFCGSVIARKLAEDGKKVLILERRNHIAGNMYDETDENGILIHRYGPHIFHTDDKRAYDFITKYGEWVPYRHRCAAVLEGIDTPSPANFKTIDLLYDKKEAESLKIELQCRYEGQKSVTITELLESEDISIKKYAEKLYEENYKPYTVKQWGIMPENMDSEIIRRVPVRLDYTDAYFDDEYQVLPENGYTQFFKNLLDHENIEVKLNTDAADLIRIDVPGNQILFEDKPLGIPLVFSGSIDEIFGNCFGHLPYRSLNFDYHTKSVDSFQEAPVVVHPKAKGFTRITEYKKMPPQNINGITTIVYEYPLPADKANGKEQYYPILTKDNEALYKKYLSIIDKIKGLYLCGRLANYKYYDMDDAILHALEVYNSIQGKV